MTFRSILNARGTIPIWGTFCLLGAGVAAGQLIQRLMLQELGFVRNSNFSILFDLLVCGACAALAAYSIEPQAARA